MSRLGVCVVAALLLSAGCLTDPGVGAPEPGGVPQAPGDGPVPADPSGVAPGEGAPGSLDNGSDVPRSLESVAVNPWNAEEVVVAIDAPPSDSGEYRDAVAAAVDYWNRNDVRYGTYSVNFVLEPDATRPHVLVDFTSTVICHGEAGWLGCSPVLNASSDPGEPTTVQINTEYRPETVQRTVKHEFGHLLGIRHGEAPMPLMGELQNVDLEPQENVSNRRNPWQTDRIEVYVEYGDVTDDREAAIREQVQHALSYYNAGAEGTVPRDVAFVETDSRDDAEIVVQFFDDPWCRDGPGSCGETRGIDADEDDTVEYHSKSWIAVSDVRTEAVGWHVGYWIGASMGADDRGEMPPAFQQGANRTGTWWETD